MKSIVHLIETIRDSFYNPAKYAEVAQKGFSSALGYATICALIAATFAAAVVAPGFYKLSKLDLSASVVDAYYPEGLEVVIRDGVASTTAEQPYRLNFEGMKMDANSPKYFLTIDTTHSLTMDEVRAFDSFVVLGERSIYARQQAGEVRAYDLAGIKELTVNEQVVTDFAQKVRPWIQAGIVLLPLVVFLFVGFGVTLATLFIAVLGALVVMLMGKVRGVPLTYGSAYMIALYASIPLTILDIATDATSLGNFFPLSLAAFLIVIFVNLRPEEVKVAE